ncbi:MAG: DUF4124 domain-containing protein [Pseudomonadota bacterium]|nr:DUF4124 domain-containing protein [Pseudomonadota bacterium]
MALGLILVGSIGPVQAQWTWRDQHGHINASDRPPPRDIPEKDILSRPQPARNPAPPPPAASAGATAASAPVGALERAVEAKKQAAQQEQAAKAKAEEERLTTARAENCRRARSQQTALESGQRMARMNDKGEREILDDKGRADELRQARSVIGSDCR